MQGITTSPVPFVAAPQTAAIFGDVTGYSTRSRSGVDLARDFESVFVSMMIKEMRQSSSGEGLFAGDKSDTFGGMFDMFMSQHIAENGGFGMAKFIEDSPAFRLAGKEAYTRNSTGNP